MKCHFEYKGRSYENLSDLYPIILGEMEAGNSVATIESPKQTIITIKGKTVQLPKINTFVTDQVIDESPLVEEESEGVEVAITSFDDFASSYELTDSDRSLAEVNIDNGELVVGKDIITKEGVFTLMNWNPTRNNLFNFFEKGKEDEVVKKTKAAAIDMLAMHTAFENAVSKQVSKAEQAGKMPTAQNEPEMPTQKTELETFMEIDYAKDNSFPVTISADNLGVLKQVGYDTKQSSFDNISAMLFNLSTFTDNPIKKYLATNMLNKVEVFKDLEIIIDFTLNRAGVTNMRSTNTGSVTSIRINPQLLRNKEHYAEVMLEELTHALVYEDLRDENSVAVQNLKEIQSQAITAFGPELLQEYNFKFKKLREVNEKERVGIELTEEELAFRTNFKAKLANNPDDRRIVYRLNNFDEFVAGVLIDKDFQTFLNQIRESDTNKSLWEKFLDVVKKVAKKFGLSTDSLLQYALTDALSITNDVLSNPKTSIGKSLNGNYVRSKQFINNKLGLTDEQGNPVAIVNGKEVVDFINTNFNNVVAINNQDKQTVEVYYRSELNPKEVKAIEDLYAYDPSGSAFDFNDDADGGFNEDETGGLFNSEDVSTFKLQAKAYLINLNDRLNSLYKSRQLVTDSVEDSPESTNNKFKALEVLGEEINNIKENIRKITADVDGSITGLIGLSYQGEEELEKISKVISGDMNVQDIKYALQTVKFWREAKSFVFTPSDYVKDKLVNRYDEVQNKAEKVMKDLMRQLDSYVLNNMVKKNTRFDGSVADLAKEFVDPSTFRSLIDNLNVTQSSLLSAIGIEIKKQNEIRQQELLQRQKQFKGIIEKAKPFLVGKGNDSHEIFRQLDDKGRKTRNMVARESYQYQKARKGLNFVYDNKSKRDKEDAFNALRFLNKNTEQVKYSVLFPIKEDSFDQVAHDLEYNRLKELMGDNHFNEWYASQAEKIKSYKDYRAYKVADILERNKLKSEDDIAGNPNAAKGLDIFEELNSPYLIEERLANFDGKNPFMLKRNYQNYKYIKDFPKAEITFNDGGKEATAPGYDEKYKKIQATPELANYYNEINNILSEVRNFVPYDTGEKLAVNGLPEFKLSMYENMMSGGMKAAFWGVSDAYIDMITTEKYDSKGKELDIITGRQKRRLALGITNSNNKIKEEVEVRKVRYKLDTKKNATDEMIEDWRSEIMEKYANEMDFDLSRVMNQYLVLGMAYKHKSKIEDGLIIAQQMLEGMKEAQRDSKGNILTDLTNQGDIGPLYSETADSFGNSKKMVEHTISSILYGDTRKVSSTSTKKYTKAEKTHKKALEDLKEEVNQAFAENRLGEAEANLTLKKIQQQIDNLGAYGDTEKYWDLPIKFTQYKGMGWNVIGGISNMVFGTVSNLIESASDQIYTSEEYAKAFGKVMMHSARRNATFNSWSSPEALKIRALMDNFDIMADSGTEYKSLMGKDITEKLKMLSAFNMNSRTEYINQAPLMIIMFEKAKFEHNGTEFNLYEAFDSTGEWDTETYGKYPEELIRKTTLKVKALIERNHGNYNPMSPVLAKRTSLGRLLLQFRTWMIDGYRVRFLDKDGRYDDILETTLKGRYISAFDMFKEDFSGSSLALGRQMLKQMLPYSNSYMKNNIPMEKLLNGDNNIKDYDIANMKRVAMEINLTIGMFTVMLALTAIAGEWDDDDPRKQALTLLMNQGTRLRTDLFMYLNPMEGMKLIQDPVPAMKILGDFSKFSYAVKKTIIDGSPEFESGINQGHNRIGKTLLGMFPLLSQPYRVKSNVDEVFGE